MSEQGPIFIGGPDRCGKTTMRTFLVSHPQICIPAVGSNMWTYFYGHFGDLGKNDHFEQCLDAMMHYRHVRFLQPDPERIRSEFWQGPPTYGRLFALFHQHYAEREGKSRWGDQTGLIERYADLIFAEFPAARMIHMIRDPRDRYQASLALWPDGKGRAGGATARWLYSTSLARRNLQMYPDRYKIVRFEALVRRPEETLREVCDFIGETYDPIMLTMEGDPERRAKLNRRATIQSGPSPLSEEFIGVYRQAIPKREIAFIQSFAGRIMSAFGYTLDPTGFTAVDWVLYVLLDWPANLLRLAAWLSLEMIQNKMPGRFGRRPDARMIVAQQRP